MDKRYEDALERARAGKPIDEVFPELKESEDERIRKWLYDYISNCPNNNFAFYGGVGKDAVLNYLEKQKEQKSLSISAASQWLREHVRRYINSEYNEFHKCVEYDGSIDKEKLINDFEEAMQKEQKPTKWDDKDLPQGGESIMINRILHSLMLYREMLKDSDFEEDYIKATLNNCLEDEKWLTSLETSQKPTEWSEEDEQYLLVCKNALNKYQRSDRWDATIILTWLENRLKSLRPQPKQEWSKEDVRMIGNL